MASTTLDPCKNPSFETSMGVANECLVLAALELGWTLDPTGVAPADKGTYECFRAPRKLPMAVVYKLVASDGRCKYIIDTVYACHGALVRNSEGMFSVCGSPFGMFENADTVVKEFEKRRWSPKKEYDASLIPTIRQAYAALVTL